MKIIAALSVSLLALCWAAASFAETIKVGVMLPFSGPNSDLGNQVDKAFDLYVKLHAKDLGDNKIEIIKRDEGPVSGAGARTAATELITNDKVKLIAGFVFSPGVIAVAPLATQAKMPMLVANAGTAWITTLSPYIVRFSFSMWDPAYPMGTYAAKNSTARPPPPGLPTTRPDRIRRSPSRPPSRKPAARSSTRCGWARRGRCPISRRSFSASRTNTPIASTSSFRPVRTPAV